MQGGPSQQRRAAPESRAEKQTSWAPHGASWAPHGASWAPHGASWAPHRASWAPHGASWAPHWAGRAGRAGRAGLLGRAALPGRAAFAGQAARERMHVRREEMCMGRKLRAWAQSCVHGRKAACMGGRLRAWAQSCVHGRKGACMGGKLRAWAESCVHACMHLFELLLDACHVGQVRGRVPGLVRANVEQSVDGGLDSLPLLALLVLLVHGCGKSHILLPHESMLSGGRQKKPRRNGHLLSTHSLPPEALAGHACRNRPGTRAGTARARGQERPGHGHACLAGRGRAQLQRSQSAPAERACHLCLCLTSWPRFAE
jgi:hypothetical protein